MITTSLKKVSNETFGLLVQNQVLIVFMNSATNNKNVPHIQQKYKSL